MRNVIRRRITYANLMSTLALFVALGGGAVAATKFVGANGVVRLCATRGGAVKVLKPGQKCGRGKSLVSVNQRGQQGPRGLQGQQGPQGPPGGAGGGGSYTAGSGLSLNGSTFSANFGQVQARVGGCASDQLLQSVNQAGTPGCVPDHAYSNHGFTFSTGDVATVNVPPGSWVLMADDSIVPNDVSGTDQECDINVNGTMIASGLQYQAGQDSNVTAIGATTTTLPSTQIQAVCKADGSAIHASTGASIIAIPAAALN